MPRSKVSQFILSQEHIAFHLVSGQSGPVEGDLPIRVMVQSNVANWALNYQAAPLFGPGGEIMPDRILIRSPYSNGFESLEMPRLVGKGNITGATPVDVAQISLRYMASGQEKPGIYEGNIFSPDGGPTIHVGIIIEPRVEEIKPEMPEIEKPPAPKVNMTFSPDRIHFPVTGAPGDYNADSAILLTVESKYGFVVKPHATPLHGQYGDIPPDRLFLNPSDGNYHSLEKALVVLERPVEIPEKEKTVSTNLSFRLKTTWDDKAGEYTGQIVFTCEPEM